MHINLIVNFLLYFETATDIRYNTLYDIIMDLVCLFFKFPNRRELSQSCSSLLFLSLPNAVRSGRHFPSGDRSDSTRSPEH